MYIRKLNQADSTNNWLSQNADTLPKPCLVYCHTQTHGRGQRGNVWESEPGKNITASMIFHPDGLPACQQFYISELVALAIVEFLEDYGIKAKIKWPNDIYVGDRKICGILVEHKIMGYEISHSIIGMGINVNQTVFKSDAPNPVSIKMLNGEEYDIDKAVVKLANCLQKSISKLNMSHTFHVQFLSTLWRKDGRIYNFYDRKKGENIRALIENVGEDGVLTLKTGDGELRTYAFKEVEYIL